MAVDVMSSAVAGAPVAFQQAADTIAIHLSCEDNEDAWRLDVYAHTPDGRFRLGSLESIPSRFAPPRARTVAICFCPGAIGWSVQPTFVGRIEGGRAVEAACEISISGRDCCNGTDPGVNPIPPYARSLDVVDGTSGPATSVLVQAGPVQVLEVTATLDPGALAPTVIQMFDAAAIPGDGGALFAVPPSFLPVGDTYSYSPNLGDRQVTKGRWFTRGLVLVSSTSYGTKTEAGAENLIFGWIIRRGG